MSALIIVLVIIFLLLGLKLMSGFKRCPDGKIMVIYGALGNGQSSKCVTHGWGYVVPVFQSFAFLDLAPFNVDIHLIHALSKDNLCIFFKATFQLQISVEPQLMQNAAERLLGQSQQFIADLARDVIFGQIRLAVAAVNSADISANNQNLLDDIRQNCRTELGKIGLWLIDIQLNDTGLELS